MRDRKTVIPEPQPGVLPAADDMVSRLIPLEEQALGIVLLHPDILHHADIEEHFAHMDLSQAVLDNIRSAVLEITSAAQSIDCASLCTALAARGLNENVQTLLSNGLQIKLRTEIMENAKFAMQAFESAYSAYTDKKLEHEIKEAASQFERDMSEQNQSRLFSLQKQRDELRRSHYVFTSEDN